MNEGDAYSSYHPRWYRRHVSTYWWASRGSYFVFILRELSSIFVAWFVVYLLLLVRAVAGGNERYQEFLAWSAHPLVLLLNVVSFLFIVFHAITWFNLAPQAMVVKAGGKKVPGFLIAASNYVGWAVVSAALAWLLVWA
jgi:fumarate reductase subunit C